MSDELTSLKVDVGILKTQMNSITILCDKMDTVIQKLTDNQERIVNQIYNDMQKREDDKDADVKELHTRINSVSKDLSDKVELTERRIMDEIKSLRNHIIEHNKKEDDNFQKILEWKWMIIGAILVVVWMTSNGNLEILSKFFH